MRGTWNDPSYFAKSSGLHKLPPFPSFSKRRGFEVAGARCAEDDHVDDGDDDDDGDDVDDNNDDDNDVDVDVVVDDDDDDGDADANDYDNDTDFKFPADGLQSRIRDFLEIFEKNCGGGNWGNLQE